MALAIVDTSSIIFALSNRKNVFEALKSRGYTPCISRGITRELRGMSLGRGRNASLARIALLEVKAKGINIYPANYYPDKWILSAASRHSGSMVVTNDTALARKLVGLGIGVLKVSKEGILKRFK